MPNRVLRDWTCSEIKQRVSAIEEILNKMPKATGEYRNLQPLKWNFYCEKRRLNLEMAKRKGTHSFKEGRDFLIKNSFKCVNCGNSENPSLDHIIPISMGGSDSLSNKQVLCISCNSSKGKK